MNHKLQSLAIKMGNVFEFLHFRCEFCVCNQLAYGLKCSAFLSCVYFVSRKRHCGSAWIFVYYHAVKMKRFMRCDNDKPLFKMILSHFDFMPFAFRNRNYYCSFLCLFISWKMCAHPLNSRLHVYTSSCVAFWWALSMRFGFFFRTRSCKRAPLFRARTHQYQIRLRFNFVFAAIYLGSLFFTYILVPLLNAFPPNH